MADDYGYDNELELLGPLILDDLPDFELYTEVTENVKMSNNYIRIRRFDGHKLSLLDTAILKLVCLLSLSICTLLQLYCVVRIKFMCII